MSPAIHSSSDSSGLSLAVRLQHDSADAWRDLVGLYGPLVAGWTRQMGLDAVTGDDIAQEVFLAVHRSICQFDPSAEGATFRGWLWRITRNAVLQSQRLRIPEARGGSTAEAALAQIHDPIADSLPDEPPSSPDETAALVDRAMQQIKSQVEPTTWQAFMRTTAGGESATDVAESLGLTPAAVRKAKSRTLQRLRKQLGDQR